MVNLLLSASRLKRKTQKRDVDGWPKQLSCDRRIARIEDTRSKE